MGVNAALLDTFVTVRHDGSQLVAAKAPAGESLSTGSATATQSVGQLGTRQQRCGRAPSGNARQTLTLTRPL